MKHNAFSSACLLILGGLLLCAACSKQPASERDPGRLARYVLTSQVPPVGFSPITVDLVYDDQNRVVETVANGTGPDSVNVPHCYYFFNSQGQCVRCDVRTGVDNTLSLVEEFVYEQGKHVRTNRYLSPAENAPLPQPNEFDLFAYPDNNTIEEQRFSNGELVQVVVHQLNTSGLTVAREYRNPDGTINRTASLQYFDDGNLLNFTPGVVVSDSRFVQLENNTFSGQGVAAYGFTMQKDADRVVRYESTDSSPWGTFSVITFEYE